MWWSSCPISISLVRENIQDFENRRAENSVLIITRAIANHIKDTDFGRATPCIVNNANYGIWILRLKIKIEFAIKPKKASK